jgi:hypothetical protein
MPNQCHDSTPTLDPFTHSVSLQLDWTTEHPAMEDAIEELLVFFADTQGHESINIKHLRTILIMCAQMRKQQSSYFIAYSRNNNPSSLSKNSNPLKVTPRPLIRIINVLEANQFLENHIGFNETIELRRRSRFRATELLNELIDDYALDQIKYEKELIRNGIVLKDNNKNFIYNYEDTEQTIRSGIIISGYNKLLAQSSITLEISNPTKNYLFDKTKTYRVFNNSDFTQGGRFYGNWWCNASKLDRNFIYINEQPTIELDYKANHLGLLYELGNVTNPDFNNNDPYDISTSIDRKIIKHIILISLNASNKNKAYGAIRKYMCNGIEDREIQLEWEEAIPNRQAFNSILTLISNSHPILNNYLCSGIGLKLQYMDSQIAEYVINKLTEQNIVALCIHDSFRVQRRYEVELRRFMIEAYIESGYHRPCIE